LQTNKKSSFTRLCCKTTKKSKQMIFIIVLYKCSLKDSASYQTVTKSLACAGKKGVLFVFDNSPEMQVLDDVDSAIWQHVEYVHCPENKGLGVAYNQGATYAKKNDMDWIVLLDQDTTFSENYISKLDEAIKQHSEIKLFAPIIQLKNQKPFSPTRYKHKRGYSVKLTSGIYSFSKYSPVNSGMVINTNSFWEAGGYNPDIRLDFADFQFIERFRHVEKTFFAVDTVAIQDFSNEEKEVKKLQTRFKIYCECAKKCERKNIVDSLGYLYSVFRHTLGLTLKTKNMSFLRIFMVKYLFA